MSIKFGIFVLKYLDKRPNLDLPSPWVDTAKHDQVLTFAARRRPATDQTLKVL